jgi:hypothetical protein
MNSYSSTSTKVRNGFAAIALVLCNLVGNAMLQALVLRARLRAYVRTRGSIQDSHYLC